MKVTVIDYGSSNLQSVCWGFEACGAAIQLAGTPNEIEQADRLVLPGVGAFADCADGLKQRGLDQAIQSYFSRDRPFLGICVGMQLLFEDSEEGGLHPGLGYLPGRVRAIPQADEDGTRKVPHIGWRSLTAPNGADSWRDTILASLTGEDYVYFVHSFAARLENDADCLAMTSHDGAPITAAVGRGNVFGVQFHPEKSGPIGLKILQDFLEHS